MKVFARYDMMMSAMMIWKFDRYQLEAIMSTGDAVSLT